MKRKLNVIIIIVFFITVLLGFRYLIKTIIMKTNIELPVRIDFPENYKTLFNNDVQKSIKHYYSEKYNKQETLPISFIKLDSFRINIFKYRSSEQLLKMLKIRDNKFKKGRFISNYHSIGSLNIDMLYRNNLTKKMDTLYIRSTKPIDTLLFNQNKVILKGIMGNLEIKVDKSKQGADQYFDDETYLKEPSKYYLAWIQKNGYIYELFIETKRFDDKKMMSLFE